MANKLTLALVLVLVIGFAATTAVAFHQAASLYDDATTALSSRLDTLTAPAALPTSDEAGTALVARR